MIIVAIAYFFVAALVAMAFFLWRPKNTSPEWFVRYNVWAFVAALACSLLVGFRQHNVMAGTPDGAWAPLFGIFSAALVFVLTIGAATLMRNLIIFPILHHIGFKSTAIDEGSNQPESRSRRLP